MCGLGIRTVVGGGSWVGRVGQSDRGKRCGVGWGGVGWGGEGTRISVWIGYQDGGGWWVVGGGWIEWDSQTGEAGGWGWGGGGTRISVWVGYQDSGGWIEWDSQTGGRVGLMGQDVPGLVCGLGIRRTVVGGWSGAERGEWGGVGWVG